MKIIQQTKNINSNNECSNEIHKELENLAIKVYSKRIQERVKSARERLEERRNRLLKEKASAKVNADANLPTIIF